MYDHNNNQEKLIKFPQSCDNYSWERQKSLKKNRKFNEL